MIEQHSAMGSACDFWRTEPEKKRLMLRLWLDVERKARRVVREIHIYENAGGRSAIDPQPRRLPAVAKYRTPDSEVQRQAPSRYPQVAAIAGKRQRLSSTGSDGQRRGTAVGKIYMFHALINHRGRNVRID